MRKITLFAMLLVGILVARAECTFVGAYDGVIELAHFSGEESTMEAQSVTISEVEGKVNVTFPSFVIMTGTELGVFTIEDVDVIDNEDGTYALSKEQFTINVTLPNGGTTSFGYCAMIGEVYADGGIAISVDIVQNPSLPAPLTTAYFYSETADFSAVLGEYAGKLQFTHVDGTKVDVEGEQLVTISETEDGKFNVAFPSITLVMGMETGAITIEDVTVTDNGAGSYGLSKEVFNIASGMMSFPNSTFSGTVYADGKVEMSVAVQQQPGMAMTTAKFTVGISGGDDTEEPTDPSVFEWGTATWNTEDGVVYDGIVEFEAAGLTLSYPNPSGFALGFLNVLAVNYDVYIDEAEEPVKASSSVQGSTELLINYPFIEGHSYKIVTTGALLAQANLATYTTDTLTTNDVSYEISFTINGPELQKTIEVEAWMSLAITDQYSPQTVSKIDVTEITSALGISDMSEADMHPLRPNGSYCDHMDYFDWWRDADGDFVPYNGGWNSVLGGNAKPAVYSIKVNEAADSVTYYFFDVWKEYVPVEDEDGTVGGGTITTRATEIWDWDNGDGTTTQYNRTYRVEEGKDYVSEVLYVANKKSVLLRATLHFVTEEEWEEITAIEEPTQVASEAVEYYSISGVRQPSLQKGINIVRYADGTTRKVMVK